MFSPQAAAQAVDVIVKETQAQEAVMKQPSQEDL